MFNTRRQDDIGLGNPGTTREARRPGGSDFLGTNILPLFLVLVAAAGMSPAAIAQSTRMNYLHDSNMPPGFVGQQQLLRRPSMAGYIQPVQIQAPEGVRISLQVDGRFADPRPAPVLCGMQLGYVYVMKVTNIPLREGVEIFPSVELVNRLYPPEGMQLHFPVPIELTTEEIDLAIDGRFVTRVIYLEDADNPLALRDDPRHQRFVEIGPGEDPLHAADRYGRPMAILRLGSRVPDDGNAGMPELASPPIQIYPNPVYSDGTPRGPGDANRAIERFGKDIPRESLNAPAR